MTEPIECWPAAAFPTVPRPRVLCVDDEPMVLEGLRLRLRERYEVLTASSAAAGLELLHRDPSIAVLVTDLRMPRTDGISFLRLARSIAPDTSRILLSGQLDVGNGVDSVNDGQVCACLLKPCPPDVLLAAVNAACSQSRLHRAQRLFAEQCERDRAKPIAETLRQAALAFGWRYAAMVLQDDRGERRGFWGCGLPADLYPPGQPLPPALAPCANGGGTVRLRANDAPALEGLPPGHPPVKELLGLALPAMTHCSGWLYFADPQAQPTATADDVLAAAVLAGACSQACHRAAAHAMEALPETAE